MVLDGALVPLPPPPARAAVAPLLPTAAAGVLSRRLGGMTSIEKSAKSVEAPRYFDRGGVSIENRKSSERARAIRSLTKERFRFFFFSFFFNSLSLVHSLSLSTFSPQRIPKFRSPPSHLVSEVCPQVRSFKNARKAASFPFRKNRNDGINDDDGDGIDEPLSLGSLPALWARANTSPCR